MMLLKKKQRTLREIIHQGTIEERKYLFSKSFKLFFAYYYSEYFTYTTPDFHKEMFNDLKDLTQDEIDYIVWVMFRESAKTSIVKAFIVWCIAYRKRNFINYDSYDKDNSEAALFDIAVQLQTNPLILRDFGQLYFNEAKDKKTKKQADMKRLNEFITTNGVKVKAYSTQKSTRGRIFGRHRPDMYVLDDFENEVTMLSWPATMKVIKHIDSLKAGAAPGAWIIALCNLIIETGSVAHIIEKANDDERTRVRKVNVVDKKGRIAWPDKYVHTDEEARKLNAMITNKDKKKVSLENKRKKLGKDVFEREMMNNPAATTDIVFDRAKMDELIAKCKEPTETIAGFKIWAEYNAAHRYGGGADTSEGVGRDANAATWFDFTVYPRKVVATYKNNKIAPDVFGHELYRQGSYFDFPVLAIERNNTGHTTILGVRTAGYSLGRLYKETQEDRDKSGSDVTDRIGWQTNRSTKTQAIYEFKSALENGEVEVLDVNLLRECRAFNQSDLEKMEYEEGMTKHYDLLMSAAIGWQMHKYALSPQSNRKLYKQSTYRPQSRYEGGDTA